MAGGMDLVVLRQLVGNVVAGLAVHTHRELGEACERLGLPEPPDEGTKRERVDHSFAALSDADLPMVAERILTSHLRVDAATRNVIQDVLVGPWVIHRSFGRPVSYRPYAFGSAVSAWRCSPARRSCARMVRPATAAPCR